MVEDADASPAHYVPAAALGLARTAFREYLSLVLDPGFTPLADLTMALRARGHAALSPASLTELTGASLIELDALRPSWNDLPPDAIYGTVGDTAAVATRASSSTVMASHWRHLARIGNRSTTTRFTEASRLV